jgi:hypothetical protein
VIRQALGEECMSRTRVIQWQIPKSSRQNKASQWRSEVKSILIIFFDIKGVANKEFAFADLTAILHLTPTLYDDRVQACEDFSPDFGDKQTIKHCLTLCPSPGNSFYQRQYDRRPPAHPTRPTCPPTTFSASQMEDNCHLTQSSWSRQNRSRCSTQCQITTSRMQLGITRKAWNCAYTQNGTTSRAILAPKSNVSF